MTEPQPYASAAALAGLAREVEGLRRHVDGLGMLRQRLDEVAGMVLRLADTVASRGAGEPQEATVSWLALPADAGPDDAESILLNLIQWMGTVHLRYADAARSLPACWLWHPDVVEELLSLHQSWATAYQSGAAVSLAADWHDRLRPGAVRRIRDAAGMCSIENHQPGRDRQAAAPQVPLASAATAIATWWATARSGPPPEPTAEQVAATATRPRSRA